MALTPMMKQYLEVKEQHEDAILFFRLGDFYEMFMEDAKIASEILEIALTGRDAGLEERIPMCGIPYHAASVYVKKLIDAGRKVAICEQVEDPKLTKGIVKREVIKIITPGTILDETSLDEKKNNYIIGVSHEGDYYGLSFADITTGEFKTTAIDAREGSKRLKAEITRIKPSECIVDTEELFTELEEYRSYTTLFKGKIVKGDALFAFEETLGGYSGIRKSANLLYSYISDTQKGNIGYLKRIDYYCLSDYLFLDSQTRRNLEITENLRKGTSKNTLLSVLDKTRTAMGGRLLKKWLEQPLLDKGAIEERQRCVRTFKEDLLLMERVGKSLKGVYDLERILGKLSYGHGNSRDLGALKNSLVKIQGVKDYILESGREHLMHYARSIGEHSELINLLEKGLEEDLPISVKEGQMIRKGYREDIDEVKDVSQNAKALLLAMEQQEKERTGVKSLKIGYNKVFGYYIEVTKTNAHLVPDNYVRKQTIANGERFINEELKELEYRIVHAQERLNQLEYEAFQELRRRVLEEMDELKETAYSVAGIDVFLSFARVAAMRDYVEPDIREDTLIEMKDGRHPVVESLIGEGTYIPNDFIMNPLEENLGIITGPNMAGKSTFIRTLAILTLMAQAGSFVPASSFKIGLCDRIFARVGASDDLARGESTFMVEMNEVATILETGTERSLVILDEVGRGTSTLDGLSIAWAVSEYFLTKLKARTVFATHYHELIELENSFTNVVNLSMAVQEYEDKVVFLRKVIPGGTSRSYGIHVGKMAGLPPELIKRAEEKLEDFSRHGVGEGVNSGSQLSFDFVEKENPLKKALDLVNPNELTPMEALQLLYELKKLSK